MSTTTTGTEEISLQLDRDLKRQADELFGEMGLSLSTACSIFVRQALLEGSIPFDFIVTNRDMCR